MPLPTPNKAERLMALDLQRMDEEEPDTAEDKTFRQERNLREIRITHKTVKDPRQKEILAKEFETGLANGDFPPGSVLDETADVPARTQGAVRKTESGEGDPSNPPVMGKNTDKPNVQVETVDTIAGPTVVTPGNNNPVKAGYAALRGFIEQNRQVVDDLIRDTTKSTEEAARENQTAAAQALFAGEQKALAARVTGTIEAAGAQTKERILKIANLDTRSADNAFATALAERMQLKKQRETLAVDIDAREAVGLFDDPLQYLVNQTILPGRIAEYNNLARRENDNIHRVDTLQREVAAQEGLDLGATADLYTSRATHIANSDAATAAANAAELRARAQGLIANRVMAVANLTERRINHQEIMSKWAIALADKREMDQKKEDDRQDELDKNRRVKMVGGLIGNNMATFKWLKGQSKEVQEMWATRAGTLSLGDSLPETMEFVRRFGDLNAMRLSGTAELADMFKAFEGEINKRADNIANTWATAHPELATRPPKRAEAQRIAAELLQGEWEGQRDNNMFKADPTNPYGINHKAAVRWYKGDKNNPIFLMVNEADKAGQLVNDKTLFAATEKLIRDGTLPIRDASGALAEYYSDAITRNNWNRSPRNMGLEIQKGYKVKPDGSQNIIDLTNPMAVENFFTYTAMRARAEAAGFVVPQGMDVREETAFGQHAGFALTNPPKKQPVEDLMAGGARKRKADAAKPPAKGEGN